MHPHHDVSIPKYQIIQFLKHIESLGGGGRGRPQQTTSICQRSMLKNGSQKFKGRGKFVTYTCSSGYHLVGQMTSVCEKGRWNSPVPICISKFILNRNYMNCAFHIFLRLSLLTIWLKIHLITFAESIQSISIFFILEPGCPDLEVPENGNLFHEHSKASSRLFCSSGYEIAGILCQIWCFSPTKLIQKFQEPPQPTVMARNGTVHWVIVVKLEQSRKSGVILRRLIYAVGSMIQTMIFLGRGVTVALRHQLNNILDQRLITLQIKRIQVG